MLIEVVILEKREHPLRAKYINPMPSIEDLCNMLCPALIGEYDLKLAFLISLVGGFNRNKTETETALKQKFSLNILVVGNPSCGKSQLAVWLSKLGFSKLQNSYGLTGIC